MTFLPSPFFDFRLVLPMVISMIILQRPTHAAVLAFAAGTTMDVFAQSTITLAFARLLIISLCVAFLAETVLTNQSLYAALALGAMARLLDFLWLAVLQFVTHLKQPHIAAILPRWSDAWKIMLWDAVVIAIFFWVSTILLKRFVAFRGKSRSF